jgi:predicted lipoprotein with Yx(FWY)xxD motif
MVNKALNLLCAAAALALLAGCGSSSSSATTPAATTPAATTPTSSAAASTTPASASNAVVLTTKHARMGTILAAGPKKLTVYLWESDKGDTSVCSGACEKVWPPVRSGEAGKAAGAAVAADLGTTTRSDGTKQLTYKGHPLYYYVKDKDDEDVYGQGSNSFGAGWYVMGPSGTKIDEDGGDGGAS